MSLFFISILSKMIIRKRKTIDIAKNFAYERIIINSRDFRKMRVI